MVVRLVCESFGVRRSSRGEKDGLHTPCRAAAGGGGGAPGARAAVQRHLGAHHARAGPRDGPVGHLLRPAGHDGGHVRRGLERRVGRQQHLRVRPDADGLVRVPALAGLRGAAAGDRGRRRVPRLLLRRPARRPEDDQRHRQLAGPVRDLDDHPAAAELAQLPVPQRRARRALRQHPLPLRRLRHGGLPQRHLGARPVLRAGQRLPLGLLARRLGARAARPGRAHLPVYAPRRRARHRGPHAHPLRRLQRRLRHLPQRREREERERERRGDRAREREREKRPGE